MSVCSATSARGRGHHFPTLELAPSSDLNQWLGKVNKMVRMTSSARVQRRKMTQAGPRSWRRSLEDITTSRGCSCRGDVFQVVWNPNLETVGLPCCGQKGDEPASYHQPRACSLVRTTGGGTDTRSIGIEDGSSREEKR